MALTFRQKMLLAKFIDCFQEEKKPIHYTAVARRLGLSNTAAYEVLRKFEQSGRVEAVYEAPNGPGKRGRARVLFVPTQESLDMRQDLAGGIPPARSWDDVKSRIIELLEIEPEAYPGARENFQLLFSKISEMASGLAGHGPESDIALQLDELKSFVLTNLGYKSRERYRKAARQLFVTLTEAEPPLLRCAHVVAISSLLAGQALQEHPGSIRQSSLSLISGIRPSKEGTSILFGVTLGVYLMGKGPRLGQEDYQASLQCFEESLDKLTLEEIKSLHGFTQSLWAKLLQKPNHQKA